MDNTYNKLIETGIRLFGDYGVDGVSIRDIVAASGANLSAVSYHFGGKGELYKAVINHLVNEVKSQQTEAEANDFKQLSLAEMEIAIPKIILNFHDLFLSRNGISRLNIFTRELASSDKYLVHNYFFEMVDHVRKFFHSILTAYYSARNEPTDKVEFVTSLLITTLKNISCKESLPMLARYQQPDMINRLTNLILYSKL